MKEIIFTSSDTRRYLIAAITKNWGGNGWESLNKKQRLDRIHEIHQTVNTLLSVEDDPISSIVVKAKA